MRSGIFILIKIICSKILIISNDLCLCFNKQCVKVNQSHNCRLSSATKETIIEYTNTNNDILQDCIIKYRTVAEKADGHAADAERLIEGWPYE